LKELREQLASPETPLEGERWALVQRAAGSAYFARSPRLRQFLLYVCDRELRGKTEEINEQQIGTVVFGRPADYDTTADNIVRVEARHLRQRLEQYFSAEGLHEPVVITVPKGGYVPVFEPRPAAGNGSAPAVEKAQPAAPAVAARTHTTPLWAAIALLSVACLGLLIWSLSLNGGQARPLGPDPLWSQLFDDTHQTSLVIADSNLALLQDLTNENVGLESYIGRKYIERLEQQAKDNPALAELPIIASRQYTSLADVSVSGRILQRNYRFADRTAVKFARNLQIRDFRQDHVILLGAVRANPWVSLFEPSLNFIYEMDFPSRRPKFRNKSPLPGEAKYYWMRGPDGTSQEAYATISFLPNLARNGNVLIIAGTNMEGTEAAGDYITNPKLTAALLERMGMKDSAKPFEVLLKLRTVGGSSSDTEVVAYRKP
jgi:hypothetical protein